MAVHPRARALPLGISRGVAVLAVVALATGLLIGASAPAVAAVGDLTGFALPAGSDPWGVTSGPDGNLWVVNGTSGTISKVTITGDVTTFRIPTPNSQPRGIAAGSDGALWFTMQGANKIGRITTAGVVNEYAVPTANALPFYIAAGPDGALWFTEYRGNNIGRITTDGAIAEYAVPTVGAYPMGITAGPAGSNRMYFTELIAGKVGYITMGGALTETITLPAGALPQGIATIGGSVWFVERGGNSLDRLLSDVTVSRIPLGAGTNPQQLAPGPGGTMWMTAAGTGKVWKLSSDGVALGSPFPVSVPLNNALVAGRDGNIWVTQNLTGGLVRVVSGQVPAVTGIPTVSPVAGVAPGTVLIATTGGWDYAPTTYSYQWQRCSSADTSTCLSITGATATAYTATGDDSSRFLRVGVTASNLSGAAAAAYSASLAVGGPTPAPAPAPAPFPAPATGDTASVGSGATVHLIAPRSQQRGRSKAYRVVFSSISVQGTVTLQFRHGSKMRTVSGLTVNSGSARYRWKAPRKWAPGTTTVLATFLPATGSAFTAARMKDRVRIY